MSKVSITDPRTGKTREISRSALGPWRRNGWVLSTDAPEDKPVPSYFKKPLPDVTESIVEDHKEEA